MVDKLLGMQISQVTLMVTAFPCGIFCCMDVRLRKQDPLLKGKMFGKSTGNTAVKYRDSDETWPSAPEQGDCREHSEQCQHKLAPAMRSQPQWCGNPLDAASQLLVPDTARCVGGRWGAALHCLQVVAPVFCWSV